MIATHKLQSIQFDQDFVIFVIDSVSIKIPLMEISEKLYLANDFQRNFFKISSSGYGIHWPLIDEDISVEALVKKYMK